MLIINSIEKTRLAGDSFSYSGSGVAWKARVVLFLGFAFLAGGLAGGVCVLVLKYIVSAGGPVSGKTLWMGIANLSANALVMLRYVFHVLFGVICRNDANRCSSIVLWVSQNMEDEFSYNLAL